LVGPLVTNDVEQIGELINPVLLEHVEVLRDDCLLESMDANIEACPPNIAFGPGGYVNPWRAVYKLSTGKRYEIDIYCFAPDRGPLAAIEPAKLHVASESEELKFTSGTIHKVDSEYDVKRFRFYTEPQAVGFSSALRLYLTGITQAHDGSDTSEGENEVCDVLLPVEFGGAYAQAGIRVAAVTIGAAVPAIIAANSAGKLTLPIALAMIGFAAVAGLGSVFTSLKRSS
jgi:hypothetical protein